MVCTHASHQTHAMLDAVDDGECQDSHVCAVLFEAPSFIALGGLATQWLADHPRSTPLALSHATETHYEPVASLAGPRAVIVYTGMLLVRFGSRDMSAPLPGPDHAWRDMPSGERDRLVQLLRDQPVR